MAELDAAKDAEAPARPVDEDRHLRQLPLSSPSRRRWSRFFAGQPILSGQHLQLAFSYGGVPAAVLGGAGYLTLVGLFAMGLSAIVRDTAAGIAGLAGIMFVIPPLVSILPPVSRTRSAPTSPAAPVRR